ncbi:hypothetical protein AYL99_09837 [Fonsecaea erecta]|uniref:NB-ARC domain-containing protein n=1 Tax=Fonsecaea erecta TaxID=1367422 RepID=A0A178Z9F6_9EURO|nr:hypothetical protein AYL99_09837 [Fonsecaea erecta]OAP55685.1 hypothetical protein AYL99_09837 [Fonsecaea erecta]
MSSTAAIRPLPSSVHQEGSQFGDTHVSGGVLVQGNVVGGLTINATASARANYVGHYAHSSLHPVKTFVERPKLREQIRQQLARDGNETVQDYKSRILAIWGLGGMGKTQLVLDYLQRYRSDYNATFWIEAGQKSTIERDFVNIHRLLFDVPLSARESGQDRLAEAVQRVKSWFSHRHERWLFVFDGVDSVDDPDDREYVDLLEFIPGSSTVDIIIISRSKTVEDRATLGGVKVGEMDHEQAVELFYKTSQLTAPLKETSGKVKEIVEELGCLALAVSLAGTYVRETPRLRSNVGAYLVEYRQRRRELLQRKPTKLVHQYSESVLTTWETSFRAVQEQYSAAAHLLTMLAFLSNDDIYLDLFGLEPHDPGHQDPHARIWRNLFFPKMQLDLYVVEESFRILDRYSLVHWQEDQESYSMHRLVHAWGYDRLSPVEQENLSVGSVDFIEEAISRCGATPQNRLRLAPHIMTCFGVVSSVTTERAYWEEIVSAVQRMGSFINELGRWSDVRLIELFVLETLKGLYGKEHPSTISAMNNLASTLGEQGQLEVAAQIQKEVVEKMRRILGEEHPDTISAIGNLASTLGEQGQLEAAAQMKKEVVEKRRRILGEEHPSTISAMNNLASTLGDQGRLEEAALILTQTVTLMKKSLGEGHHWTVIAKSNLARVLHSQGELD